MLLYAARIPAWIIALFVVLFAERPFENTKHEPQLLVLSTIPIAVGILYVPLARSRVQPLFGRIPSRSADLLALSALDLLAVFAILYFSGGYNTPYYHYAITVLLIPSFILGWRFALLVLFVFLAGLVSTWTFAGHGTDGPWTSNVLGYGIPGMILSPVILVVVSQYLGWLARSLEDRRQETRRSLVDTAVLYRVAYASTVEMDDRRLVSSAIRTLGETERYEHIWAVANNGEAFEEFATFDRTLARPYPLTTMADIGPVLEQRRHSPGPISVETGPTGPQIFAVPILVRESVWGALLYQQSPGAEGDALLRSVCGQLALGLTKIVLHREQEELAAQEERSRIAREIHDGIAQSIYMLSLNLEKAAERASSDPELAPKLEGLVGIAKEALLEVRHYIFDLKPLLSGDVSLASTVQSQLDEFSAVAEIPAELTVTGIEPELPLNIRASIYRILQEALANAFRHAKATQLEVGLHFRSGEVGLEIEDNGVGFEPDLAVERASGRGLDGIRDRCAELGGTVALESSTGAGTTVRVALPLTG